MSLAIAAWLLAFAVSLTVVLIASERLVNTVEAAGDRFLWPAGFVGLLAAAGADGPEVSASVIALLAGAHDVSVGVILGSNLFNLAALLGLPVLLVGSLVVQRYSLLINGAAMVLTTLLAAALLFGVLAVAMIDVLVVIVLAGYALLLIVPRDAILARVPAALRSPRHTTGDEEDEERAREREADIAQGFPSGWRLLWVGLLATAIVIGGCDVLVNATLYLAPRAGVPAGLIGVFGLAALTSLPNVWVAVSLARRGRGAVLVSAVCNSNTINLVFGLCLPAPFADPRAPSLAREVDIPALLVLTLLSVFLIWRGSGLKRTGAWGLVFAYLLFAGLRLLAVRG